LAQAVEGLNGEVRIVAVTKGHPLAAVEAALESGLKEVGENRIQEAMAKQDEATALEGVVWHLIGHLQTNKAKYVPGRFALVHSVDSVRVAESLGKAQAKLEQPQEPLGVLVQVNVAKEEQKNGCAPEEADEVASCVVDTPGLALRGLMTMAPFDIDEVEQRSVFSKLRRLKEDLAQEGFELPELSMGMSSDFRAAVAEGATILRLGTVLFGKRGA